MRKNILIYILICLPVILFTQCDEADEFLEIKPKASIVTGSYYSTMEEADQAIAAAYSTFNATAVWDRNIIMGLGSVTSDDAEAGGEHVNEVPEQEHFNRFTYTSTADELEAVYGNLFRGIYFSNLAIENLPRILDLDDDADPDLLDKRIAEAHFVRAINFFYLTKVFGGVPYIDRVIGPGDYGMGRSTIKEIYELIEEDLLHAIEVLPERSEWGGDNIGRASKGAAKALLARLYLYESSYASNYSGFAADNRFEGLTERWSEALEYAEKVINSGEYELVGIGGETYNTWRGENTNGYRYIFTTEGDNSSEGIFEIQCVDEGLDYAESRGNALPRWTAPRYYVRGGQSSSTNDWGLNWPNQNLAGAFEDGDPRFSTAIAQPGDTIQIGDEWHEIYFSDDQPHRGTGYYTNKFVPSGEERATVLNWDAFPMNVRLIRLSEVYLNAAEAAFMNGDEGTALNHVNRVRERARMSGDTGVPAELTSITLNDIKNERRVELALEGHRFFDIVRWGDAEDIFIGYETNDGYDVDFEYPKHLFFPLPQREIDVSEGGLVQYEGW